MIPRSPLSFGFRLQSLYYVLRDTYVPLACWLPFTLIVKWTPPHLRHTDINLLVALLSTNSNTTAKLQRQASLWLLIICSIKPHFLCLWLFCCVQTGWCWPTYAAIVTESQTINTCSSQAVESDHLKRLLVEFAICTDGFSTYKNCNWLPAYV